MENNFSKKVFIIEANSPFLLQENINKRLNELHLEFCGEGYDISLYGNIVAHSPENRSRSVYMQTILVKELL